MNARRIAHRLLLVLVLVNGSVSVLLWSDIRSRQQRAASTSVPYALNQKLVVTIMSVDTRIRSYPNYPETFDTSSQSSPNQVWMRVWTQDKSRQTFTNYIFFMLSVRYLVLGHAVAVTLPLTLLALSLWSVHRLRRMCPKAALALMTSDERTEGVGIVSWREP